MKSTRNICFIMPYTYSLFNKDTNFVFGGSEVRSVIFGKGLAKLSEFEVSFVVFDHGQRSKEEYDGITVYAHSFLKSSLKVSWKSKARDVYYSIFKKQAMRRKNKIYEVVNADIYLSFGVSDFTAELVRFCKANKKRFVLFLGSNDDVSTEYAPGNKRFNSYGSSNEKCFEAISGADIIVAQTEQQAKLLEERFHRQAAVIANPIVLSDKYGGAERQAEYVLWVGKSDNIKQPLLLIELAKRFEGVKFLMILNKADVDMHMRAYREAPTNVKIVERVPFSEVEGYFKRALVLVNTSVFEGFPNAFLQAGKYGVPVISLNADPDGFLGKEHSGVCAGGHMTRMHEALTRIIKEPDFRNKLSRNIESYVFNKHNADKKVLELKDVLNKEVV